MSEKIMKEINFEVYTRNPEDLSVGGWDIKHVSVIAESDKQAKELLAMCQWFDCVILKNFGMDLKEVGDGLYVLNDKTRGQHGWVYERVGHGMPGNPKYELLEKKLTVPVDDKEAVSLTSEYGFYVFETDFADMSMSRKGCFNALAEAHNSAKAIAMAYSEDDVYIIGNAIARGSMSETWLGGINGETPDFGARVVRGSYIFGLALIAFKNKEADGWVERLQDAWETGNYAEAHKEHIPTLQRLPNVMFDFDLNSIEKAESAEEISALLEVVE